MQQLDLFKDYSLNNNGLKSKMHRNYNFGATKSKLEFGKPTKSDPVQTFKPVKTTHRSKLSQTTPKPLKFDPSQMTSHFKTTTPSLTKKLHIKHLGIER